MSDRSESALDVARGPSMPLRAPLAESLVPDSPDDSVQPIFLLSLPRSGSTLVQRLLASHHSIATTSEPWLLLPSLMPLGHKRALATPWDQNVHLALKEFLAATPNGESVYRREVRSMSLRLYESAAGNEKAYFIDKSPPYHWIVDELFATFPDAKFVFLWRNPVAVAASMAETLCGGRWQLHLVRGDLFQGIADLVGAYDRYRDRSIAVRYEDIVTQGPHELDRLSSYLGLELDPSALHALHNVRLNGRFGDRTGRHYGEVSAAPLEKWRRIICNPLRREWCVRYLRWIGQDRLLTMGYRLEDLLTELQSLQVGSARMGLDLIDSAVSISREIAHPRLRNDGLPSSWRLLLSRRTKSALTKQAI